MTHTTAAQFAQNNLPVFRTGATDSPKKPDARRVLIVSDAWEPQTNGVVTTLKNLRRELKRQGYRVYLITPKQFNTIPTFYPDVRLACRRVCRS